MGLDIGQQPFHRDEGGYGSGDKRNGNFQPGFMWRPAHQQRKQFVATGREHRRDADQKGKLGRRGAIGGAGQQGDENRRRRTRSTGKYCRSHLGQTNEYGHFPGDHRAIGLVGGKMFGHQHPDAADNQGPRHRRNGVGQLEAHFNDDKTEYRGNQEGGRQFECVIAILRLDQAGAHFPEPLTVNCDDGEDGAGLDKDIEKIGSMAQPVLCDQ